MTTKTRLTTGLAAPWSVTPPRIVRNANGDCVAALHSDEEATLIAAAPDLLAACKSVIEFFDKTVYKQSDEVASPAYRFDEKSFEAIGVVSLDTQAIRAAIAKAQGRD